jgi:tetratricopeptide (TPR) repeat protein
VQAGRAAKVSNEVAAVNGTPRPAAPRPAVTAPATTADVYDYEQPLEMFRAGDTAGGLRDLRRFVDANPGDKAARNKIGAAVYDRARDLEAQGAREEAFTLYEQAVALRGEPGLGWNLRIQALRRTLGEEYFEKGVQLARTSPSQAIKEWETSLRFDPQNAKAAARLKEAKSAQEKQAPAKN